MQVHDIFSHKIFGRFNLPFIIAIFLSVTSCRITKNVPENEYLLDNTKLEVVSQDKKLGIKQGELDNYIRQRPNKKVLFFRMHLRIFNWARPGREKGFSKLFRTIGEEPVILDTFQTKQSVVNLARYLESKGFYNAVVEEATTKDRRKASITYTVQPGKPYRVRNISYIIEDTLIRNLVVHDTLNRLVSRGSRFDMDLLRAERQRIESQLKEDGYFFFSRDFITLNADTSVGNFRVDVEFVIRNRFIRSEFGERIPQTYRKYEISNVYVYTRYDPVEFFLLEEAQLLDTTFYDNQYFVYPFTAGVRYKTVSNANLLRPGQIYSESSVQKSLDNLNSLRLFRAVNIFFRPDEDAEKSQQDNFLFFGDGDPLDQQPLGKLNCYIQLTPHTLQSYQVDLVGTNTDSDIGAEGNLNYQHKNIFRGAEVLDTKLRGMVQFITGERFSASSIELGGSVGLSFPRFLSPFSGQEYVKRYSPRTQISASYNYQDRPEYTRTLAGLNFSYSWRSENKFVHTFTPVEVSVINIFSISDNFLRSIENTYRFNSYKNEVVTLTGYGLIYSNQAIKRRNYSVVRLNTEVSGNVLTGLYSIFDEKSDDGTYQLLNTSFSQYVRGDINYVFNQTIDENNTFVYRIYAGAGFPYGNSKALPFEKKYFSGGSTGVRAWNARGLGPGTYVEEGTTLFYNQTADVKFEANIEYRYRLFWMLEGALFLDAGNIWAITSADERPGSVFYPDQFYKQLALGTGTGIRMNLGFFTLRVDLGMKLYDPGIRLPSEDNPDEVITNIHWIPFNQRYNWNDHFVLHFGIGYPF